MKRDKIGFYPTNKYANTAFGYITPALKIASEGPIKTDLKNRLPRELKNVKILDTYGVFSLCLEVGLMMFLVSRTARKSPKV